jgi:DNA repair protein RadD
VTFRPDRAYQRRALFLIGKAYKEGKRRILVVAPTGAGKTCIGAEVVRQFASRRHESPWSWHTHRRELASQAVAALQRAGLEPGHNGLRAMALGQVATVGRSVAREEVPPGELNVFDEAHHFAADVWKSLIDAYGPDALILGLTATPERGDGRAMSAFECIIVVAQTAELVELWRTSGGTEGLVPCEVLRPPRPQKPGFFAQSPVDAYLKSGLKGKRNVVFAPSVEEASRVAADFIAHGVPASCVHDGLRVDEREERLAAFASGKLKVLTNCFILTEGWDCPAVDVVTLAGPVRTMGGFLQRLGRGRRPSPGKEVCTLLDLVGCTHLLFDDPLDIDQELDFSLEGIGISRKTKSGPPYCLVCGALMDPELAYCPRCARPRDVDDPMRASGDPLEKFARFQRDDDATRAERFAKWQCQERDAGRNPRRAFFRYKGTYGAMPTSRVISQAQSIIMGREWCVACGHHKESDGSCRCRRVA